MGSWWDRIMVRDRKMKAKGRKRWKGRVKMGVWGLRLLTPKNRIFGQVSLQPQRGKDRKKCLQAQSKTRYCRKQRECAEQRKKRGETESEQSLIFSQQCNPQCPWLLNEARTSSGTVWLEEQNSLRNHYPTIENLSNGVCESFSR